MYQGFVKVAAVTPDLRVADTEYNTKEICKRIDEACSAGAKIIVFPELCVTGSTCGDLFGQDLLLRRAKEALGEIIRHTEGRKALVFVGLPYETNYKLYNVAAAVCDGQLLGLVTKRFLPNHGESDEKRHFEAGPDGVESVLYDGEEVLFGTGIRFACEEMPNLVVSAEIGADLMVPESPGTEAALDGATVIVNCFAGGETAGKGAYRRSLITAQSARLIAGYVCANAGTGESTTDLVFAGYNLIAENGTLLAESKAFTQGVLITEIDVDKLAQERRKNTIFLMTECTTEADVMFSLDMEETPLTRRIPKNPFVPEDIRDCGERWEEILMIQAHGLKKRLSHARCECAVVGISGGLDSTLALLVTAKAFDLLGLDKKKIISVTMPCFGTTDRTYQNACTLTDKLGATLKEVDIKASVRQHFADIGQREDVHDVTYENAQARERTQVLMDIANQENGMVIGTGDMSELALGWATYNGDHMSMYGVNASVPKTLVRHLVRHCANGAEDAELKSVLCDILDTPVSPELLPPKDDQISQKTEDLVGPYELHDFYLYYILRYGFEPKKVYRLACRAFAGSYDKETIKKWLKTFYRRFFSQQFKRSCLADGPKVGSVALSPRGDLRMPSDACATLWLEETEKLS